MKISKTNAVRILERENINYSLIAYDVDESDLSAKHVAEQLGEPIDQVFKTLVLKGDKTGYFVCVLPGSQELDLKQAAIVSGNKNCEMIPMKELLPVTGYIRGACSPIGMKKTFPSYIDASCKNFEYIYLSAGKRGLQIQISADDLTKVIPITIAVLI